MAAVCIACMSCNTLHFMQANLVLEDGTVFPGRSVGAEGVAAGEACFTTAMAGYEEAVTDPSYVAQVLCFAYPLIGNYGVDEARLESESVQAEAVVMRTARPAWAAWLRDRGVVAVDEVDTRALVRRIRANGVLRCAVGTAPVDELHARALRSRRSTAGRCAGTWGRVSRTRSAAARASRASTSAASARSRRGSPPPASRCSSSRRAGTPRRFSTSSPRRCWSATAPAIPLCSRARSRPFATCSARCRSSASASATSCSALPSAWRPTSFRSGIAARTTRCATWARAACS